MRSRLSNPAVEEYRRLRRRSVGLNQRIIEAFVDGEVIEEAARALGLGQNKQLMLDSTSEMDVLMDFALYEVKRAGRSLVERYQAEVGGKNRIERDLLAAMVRAEAGLFEVEGVNQHRCNVHLRELGEGSKVVTLTDINFSQMIPVGLVMVVRPIELGEVAMTSGVAFVFAGRMKEELVANWEQWEGLGSAERYARFFKLSKKKGMATEYAKL